MKKPLIKKCLFNLDHSKEDLKTILYIVFIKEDINLVKLQLIYCVCVCLTFATKLLGLVKGQAM